MNKSNNSIKRITLTYIISLLPLILFGFYKNGISLYIKKYVNILEMFKPLVIILLGFLIGATVNVIYEKKINKNKDNIKDIIFSSLHPIYGILIGCISSINTNIILFSLVTFIILLISKFTKNTKINYITLTSLIIFFIMNIFGKFSFLNAYEVSNNFNMNTIDYLFGKGNGGIVTTNILLLIISYIILYNSNIYKRNIPIYSFISFLLLTIIYCFIKNDIGNIMNMLFTNGILFSFVYIASEPNSSSYTRLGSTIYGIIVGVLSFIFYLINPALSSLGGIFITSIFNSLIDLKFE